MIPRVSVLMTVYNREKYIPEAIESVINANFKDLELIIVDDQSIDNSYSIANEYALKDKRIQVYQNDVNLGDYPNRNKAASYAKGEFIKYVDSDDYIYPDWFDVMLPPMIEYKNAGLGLNRFVRNSKNLGPFYYSSEQAWNTHFFKRTLFSASPLSAIIRKSTFNKVGGFSEIRYSGDQDMWFKLTKVSGLVVCEHPIAESRDHEDQERSKGKEHYLIMGRKIEKSHILSANIPMSNKNKDLALYLIDISHVYQVIKKIRNADFVMGIKLIRSYKLNISTLVILILKRILFGKSFYKYIQSKAL